MWSVFTYLTKQNMMSFNIRGWQEFILYKKLKIKEDGKN